MERRQGGRGACFRFHLGKVKISLRVGRDGFDLERSSSDTLHQNFLFWPVPFASCSVGDRILRESGIGQYVTMDMSSKMENLRLYGAEERATTSELLKSSLSHLIFV